MPNIATLVVDSASLITASGFTLNCTITNVNFGATWVKRGICIVAGGDDDYPDEDDIIFSENGEWVLGSGDSMNYNMAATGLLAGTKYRVAACGWITGWLIGAPAAPVPDVTTLSVGGFLFFLGV